LNSEFVKKALLKVGNANTLVNLVSKRVRQLTSGGGGSSRPLVAETANQGWADIALREMVEEKIGWEAVESTPTSAEPGTKKRKKV